jgi:hypothetical protein
MILYNFVWRLYNINHNWETKITKTISKDRFKNNAIWNEKVLGIIWKDLLIFWNNKNYSELLFRIWVNWILYWEKQKWLDLIKKSLKNNFNLKIFIIFILSLLNKQIILFIYKLYIKN